MLKKLSAFLMVIFMSHASYTAAQTREIAITIDDLPFVGSANNNPKPQPQGTSSLPDDMTQPAPVANTPITPAKPATVKSAPAKVSPARTHTVAAGETLAAIARKHGVSLNALESANPSINPKKLRVGQVLNLPAS